MVTNSNKEQQRATEYNNEQILMTDSELDEFLSQNDAELEMLLVQIDKDLADYFKAELPQKIQHLTTSSGACSTENDNSKVNT